jgi:MscS family membrane protein
MRRRLALLFLLLAAPLAWSGPSDQEPGDASLASPRATTFTFLKAIGAVREQRTEEWATAIGCLNLSQVGVAPESEEARMLARDLWGALNRIRVVSAEDFESYESGQDTFVYFPRPLDPLDEEILSRVDTGGRRIVLAKDGQGRWRFSAPTVAGISELYRALQPLESKIDADENELRTQPWIRSWMPAQLKAGLLLGFEYWQWLGLVVLLFCGLVLDQIVRRIATLVAGRIVRGVDGEADRKLIADTVRPVGLLAAGLLWLAFIRVLYFRGASLTAMLTAVRVFTVLAGTWAGWRAVDLASEVLQQKARQTSGKIDDILVPLLRKTAKLFLLALGIVYGAQSLNIDILPLVTGLGIGGLAFAFAAKDTIENFFGSIAVILDRPFEVGDWVVIGDVEGTVEELGFRSTRVRTFYSSQITMPNAALVRATVDNYGRRKYRRWKTTVGVQYDTTPDQLLAFTEGIRELVRSHPYTRKDGYQVWVNGFGPSSIDILLYIFHEVPDWSTELRERERLMVDIVRLADRLGVQFAFPTQTVHLYREEHAAAASKPPVPEGSSERRAWDEGIRQAQTLVRNQPWQGEKPPPVVHRKGPSPFGGDSRE